VASEIKKMQVPAYAPTVVGVQLLEYSAVPMDVWKTDIMGDECAEEPLSMPAMESCECADAAAAVVAAAASATWSPCLGYIP
jgi:hypothetical protein